MTTTTKIKITTKTPTSVRGGRRLARAALAAATAVLTASALVILPASPASANTANIDNCRSNTRPSFTDRHPWQVRGNYIEAWQEPFGIVSFDAVRVTATGTTRIDYWGTNKNVQGDHTLAPGTWPLPSERQYALIGRLTAGYVWHDVRSRYYWANEWFPVGADSGCLAVVIPAGAGTPKLEFSINDPNLGDNGGGPFVTVRQWW